MTDSTISTPSEEQGAVIVRRNDDGTIDEIVAKGATIHIEQMSGNCFFLGIDAADGSYWQFWLGARNNKSLVDVRHTEMVTREEQDAMNKQYCELCQRSKPTARS